MTEFHVSAKPLQRTMPDREHLAGNAKLHGGSFWASLSPSFRFSLGFLTVIGMAAMVWPALPRHYESTAVLILRSADDAGIVNHSQSLKQMLDESAVQSELDVIASQPLSAEVANKLDLMNDPEFFKPSHTFLGSSTITIADPVRSIQDHLIITHDRRSYTVKFGYWSADPAKAMRMANAYLDRQVRRKQDSNTQLIDRLKLHLIELATRQATIHRLAGAGDAVTAERATQSDDLNAIALEMTGVRQHLVETVQRQAELIPDAERVAEAQFPLSAAFPNPILMVVASLLLGFLAGAILAWPSLNSRTRESLRSFAGLMDRK